MGAIILKCPELKLDEEESKMLGQASAEVAKHYNIIVSEKTQAWITLWTAISAIYGPRAVALYVRASKPKVKPSAKAEGTENVTQFPGANNVGQ